MTGEIASTPETLFSYSAAIAPLCPSTDCTASTLTRRVLGRELPGASVLAQHITLWVGFLGALLATQSYAAHRTTLVADIGTNTEISLTHNGQVYSCSCASGPAFEGAHIRDGMRAAAGAIERVSYLDGRFEVQTENAPSPASQNGRLEPGDALSVKQVVSIRC